MNNLSKNNHLIIGLGGTGGKILAAYRKLIFEKFKGDLKPEGLWIDYIYVDSSETDLNETGGIWNALGTSVALEKGSKVSIKAANLKEYIMNIDNYPYLKPWIGTADEWKNIINDPKVQDGAAGQKRRLGRFLFANRVDEFNKAVNAKVRKLQNNPAGQGITFHICCGLAGGTGSGSFIDAIAQIKNTYNDNNIYKIIPYLLLPEEIPNKSWASTDNYQPNGYAALLELNALDYQIFKPHDIGERGNVVERIETDAPFYSAYLITEQNKENVRFDVDKVLPATIAEFLFQKTVSVKDDDASKNSMLARAETGENPKYSEYGYKHSFKFITFGIKRLAIPEQEIKEYFTYNIAKQVVLQSIYNNPSNEIGYQAEPVPNDDYSEVVKSENLNKWNLSLAHLCLSSAVLDNHKAEKWTNLNEEFNIVDDFGQETLHNDVIQHDLKLKAILNQTKKYYEKDFRTSGQSGGVQEFFKIKRKVGLEEIAKKILQEVEADFFANWQNGSCSFYQLSERMKALIHFLDEQMDKIETLTVNARSTSRATEVKIKTLNEEWVGLGLIGRSVLTSRKETIANDFVNEVKKKYQMEAWIEGYAFAKDLIIEIRGGLMLLKGEIDQSNALFNKAAIIFDEEINTKCNDDMISDHSGQNIIIKHYDPQKVRTVMSQVIRRKSYMDSKVAQLRNDLVGMLGEGVKTFAKIDKQIGLEGVISQMQTSSSKIIDTLFFGTEGHDIQGFEKLIGENIIKKLKEEFGGNDIGLKNKIEELVKHASVLARYDEPQVNDGPQIRERLLVVLPEYKEDELFLEKIKNIFSGILGNDKLQIETGGNANEIVIVTLESNIALRYLKSVGSLRKKYDSLLKSPGGNVARFETHLETFKEDLPSLYKLSEAEKQEIRKKAQDESVPYLLIAKNIGMLAPCQDAETGITKLSIIEKDEYGFDKEPIYLGADLEDSVKCVTLEVYRKLEHDVVKKLRAGYKHIDKQKEAIDMIVQDVEDVKVSKGNNISDPTVKLFNSAGKKAVEIFKSINS